MNTRALTSPSAQRAALAAILLVALATRFYMAVTVPAIGDEFRWMALADTVDVRPSSLSLPLHGDEHPPVEVYLAALGAYVFGPNLLGYRAASIALGTIAVWAMFLLGRRMAGAGTGLLAAFLLAVNQYHIGVSSLATEKNYLTFAMLALLAFERAIVPPWRTRRFLLAGLFLGVGLLTKQTLALWTVLLTLDTLRDPTTRPLWRRPGPWLAIVVVLVLIAPDVYWNLAITPPPGALGVRHHVESLSLGSWNWAPFALYLRPVYHMTIEAALSEYASMTSLAGLSILLGATASLFLLTTPLARRLQWLGLTTMGFFLVFTNGPYEFWWADLSLLAFIALTAGVLARCRRGAATLIPVAVAGIMLFSCARQMQTSGYYFTLDFGRTPPALVEKFMASRRELLASHRRRDSLELCSTGGIRWPVCREYESRLVGLRDFLEQRPGALNAPDGQATYAWVTDQLERLRESLP